MLLEEIRNQARRLFAQREEIVVAYLYGSFLVSERYNDIDIGVLLEDEFEPPVFYEVEIAEELEARLGGDCLLYTSPSPRD